MTQAMAKGSRSSSVAGCAGVLLLGLAMAACGGGPAAPPPAPPVPVFTAQAGWDRISNEFLDWYLERHPVRATELGIHEHDARLPSVFPGDLERDRLELRAFLTRLQGVNRPTLEGDAYYDHRVLEYAMRAALLDLEEVGVWQREPQRYGGQIARGTANLVERQFAPLETRMRSMIGRWTQVPLLLRAARQNLDAARVPPILVTRALADTRGTVAYLSDDVPAALEGQGFASANATLRAEWEAARRLAIASTDSFVVWLDTDLRPRARGEFRLGSELLAKLLLYNEHVDIPLRDLDALNRQAVADYHEWLDRIAMDLDPMRNTRAIVDSISGEHPTAAELIEAGRSMMAEAQDFVIRANIVTLPTRALPVVRETPRYARSGFASMSTPGPFETQGTEAFYNITNVDPSWTAEQQEQHLTYFSWDGLLGITIHEVMPGHFVQLLHEARVPTRVRKVFRTSSLVEGWAHYTEQMMLDEGFHADDTGARIGQIRRALQRHARWNAALSLHAGSSTIQQAADDFVAIALFEPFPALRETERAAWDPMYLYYALGRMQILALRERLRAEQGGNFDLRAFHDELIGLGLPLPLAAEAMLGRRDPGPLLTVGARTPGVPEPPRLLD